MGSSITSELREADADTGAVPASSETSRRIFCFCKNDENHCLLVHTFLPGFWKQGGSQEALQPRAASQMWR